MADKEALHAEIKQLIVDTLGLEDIAAADIETDAPLFVEGLGLDSIDSLEIAMVLEEHYDVTFDEDPEVNQAVFQSVRTLSEYILENRKG